MPELDQQPTPPDPAELRKRRNARKDPWVEEEEEDARSLPWEEFHAKWPHRSRGAWAKRYYPTHPDEDPRKPPSSEPKPDPTSLDVADALRERAEKRRRRDQMEMAALLQEVFDELTAAVQSLPPITPAPAAPRDLVGERELALVMSDVHVGERVDPVEMGGLGGYNFEIFLERLERLRVGIEEAQGLHRAKRLNIFGLGDFVTGQSIFASQAWHVDRHVFRQTAEGAQAISAFLASLTGVFEEIHFFGVIGNHGRYGRKGEAPTMANFDYMLYVLMETLLKSYPTIRFNLSDSWFQIVRRGQAFFNLVHGDDIKSWNGIPFYGLERADRRYARMTGVDLTYTVVGHHHQPIKTDNLIMNGSFVGSTEFVAKVIMSGNLPSQKLLVIDPQRGLVTWNHDVMLADWADVRKVAIYDD